jgi:sugar/nucleoside kinase (ribokinase family)
VGSLITDDIVLPDGTTHMGVLGGGVAHTAAGMLIWGRRPGICACAGHDLAPVARQRLARDFDLSGIDWQNRPQVRAWQLFEWDGRRTEIFRTGTEEHQSNFPQPAQVPPGYRAARAVSLLRRAGDLSDWRAAFPAAVILWEPELMTHDDAAAFRAALRLADIVSPNWHEAQQFYGPLDAAEIVQAMLDDGAPMVALRLGEAGSLVAAKDRSTLLKIPAVPVPRVVDHTGAGNTYCGAFVVGWVETRDLRQAACYGAVAASFALEVTGVAGPFPDLDRERAARLTWVAGRVIEFS